MQLIRNKDLAGEQDFMNDCYVDNIFAQKRKSLISSDIGSKTLEVIGKKWLVVLVDKRQIINNTRTCTSESLVASLFYRQTNKTF